MYLLPLFAVGQQTPISQRVDSLLAVLDHEIEHRGQYMHRRGSDIATLLRKTELSHDDQATYQMLKQAFSLSRSYSMDTALMIARRCRQVAARLDQPEAQCRAALMEVEALKSVGYYAGSLSLLDSIAPDARQYNPTELYQRYCSVYYSLLEDPYPSIEAKDFHRRLLAYRDTLTHIAVGPLSKAVNTIEYLKLKGEYQAAIDTYRQYVDSSAQHEQHDNILDFVVAEAMLKVGAVDSAKYFLANAAIGDIRGCVRKYTALQTLAKVLSDQGDAKRAYNYMVCSLTDINNSNSRPRMMKIVEALPIITHAYKTQQNAARQSQRTFIIGISVFALLLALALMYAYRENRRLNRERALLKEKNEELIRMQNHLDNLNSRLEESSRTKEEYIGQLFNLCSEYINIMAREHNSLFKILKTGKIADIERSLLNVQNSTRLKAFYDKFDKVFLDLFPDFVDRFNALLQPHHRITVEPGTLNSELRIFALIRLGFTDTAQIASFLNFSPQTVYNYRFRTRNHALVDKDQFFDLVKTL